MRNLKYLRRLAIVAVLPVVLSATARAETNTNNLAIYVDRLVNGFNDWSYAPRNFDEHR